MDINLAYNPSTGANYPFTDQTRRPNRGWGNVNMNQHVPKGGEDLGLQLELNKRMSNNWQASLGYSLSAGWDYQYPPVRTAAGCEYALTNPSPGVFTCDAPITLHPVLQDEHFRSPDQMHRLTFNGIWQLPYGFQASGLYFFARQRQGDAHLRRRRAGRRRVGRPARPRTARSSSATASTGRISTAWTCAAEAVHAQPARRG